jgi:hypothetical protein
MKVIITLQQGIYSDPLYTIVERHKGQCKVLDYIELSNLIYILCDFDFPDQNTTMRRWLSPYINNNVLEWKTLHLESAWIYNVNLYHWIELKLRKSVYSMNLDNRQ